VAPAALRAASQRLEPERLLSPARLGLFHSARWWTFPPASPGRVRSVGYGKTTFSQRPCGDAAEVVEVRVAGTPSADDSGQSQPGIYDQYQDMGVGKYVDQRKARRRLEEARVNYAKLKTACDRRISYFDTALDYSVTVDRAGYNQSQANEIRLQCQKPLERAEALVQWAQEALNEINKWDNY
jgi:hypothetical protein